jgi:uncharacterized protein YdaU (DUF1376 family)
MESYPFYFDDWRKSEAVFKMTLAQRGLYRELLDWTWEKGSIPDDPEMLRSWCRVESKLWRSCWPGVREQFVIGPDGRLHNEKVDEKRPKVLSDKENSRRKAQVAAAARWSNKDAPSIAQAMPEQCTSNASRARTPSPSPSLHPACTPPTPSLSDEHVERLREIHKHWPEHRSMNFDLLVQDWISRPQYALDPEAALVRLEFATHKYLNSRDVAEGICCGLRSFIGGSAPKYLDQNVEEYYERLRTQAPAKSR